MTEDELLTCPRAVLFDMDGTITQPRLDFAQIRREMGISEGPILETLALMPASRQAHATAVLHRHEDEAAARSTLNDGCVDLLHWLAANSVRTALVTRNRLASVHTVLARHGLSFAALITREDGAFKPDPWPLRLACRRIGVGEAEAWMVGDGSHDVLAGLNAGIRTVWISHSQSRDFAAEPWRTVKDLLELKDLLSLCQPSPAHELPLPGQACL
jgi:phosphoglycolate phosphatase